MMKSNKGFSSYHQKAVKTADGWVDVSKPRRAKTFPFNASAEDIHRVFKEMSVVIKDEFKYNLTASVVAKSWVAKVGDKATFKWSEPIWAQRLGPDSLADYYSDYEEGPLILENRHHLNQDEVITLMKWFLGLLDKQEWIPVGECPIPTTSANGEVKLEKMDLNLQGVAYEAAKNRIDELLGAVASSDKGNAVVVYEKGQPYPYLNLRKQKKGKDNSFLMSEAPINHLLCLEAEEKATGAMEHQQTCKTLAKRMQDSTVEVCKSASRLFEGREEAYQNFVQGISALWEGIYSQKEEYESVANAQWGGRLDKYLLHVLQRDFADLFEQHLTLTHEQAVKLIDELVSCFAERFHALGLINRLR